MNHAMLYERFVMVCESGKTKRKSFSRLSFAMRVDLVHT